jgi:hypothetical protein
MITTIDLCTHEKKIFSQNGEDGIIAKLFEIIGFSNNYTVEIGVEAGIECNTRLLRENYHCQGIQLDGNHENLSQGLYKEFVTAENINSLFAKYDVPKEFDLLSIDIDGNDFYIWLSLQTIYQPRVVIVEYNSSHLPYEDKVVRYSSQGCWDETNYFGASILAWQNLGTYKGYCLVYAESNGINLFFIRRDILEKLNITFLNINSPTQLYRPPNYEGFRADNHPSKGHPPDPLNRPYLTSHEILSTGKFKDNRAITYQFIAYPNTKINFTKETSDLLHPKIFRQGFYLPEKEFTWLDGSYAFFTVKLDLFSDALLEFKIFTALLSHQNPTLEVEVWIHNVLIDIWHFKYNRLPDKLNQFVSCPSRLLAENDGIITIEFKIKGSSSPKQLCLSDDERHLSIAFSQIRFYNLT